MSNELVHLLRGAREEINSLRRVNEVLSAKVEVMELFACVLHTSPASRGGGMAPDVAWELSRMIDDLQKAPPAAEAGAEELGSRAVR